MTKQHKYGRTTAAARKIAEARKSALQGFAGIPGLAERFAQLDLDDLPEEEHKHHRGYVGAILEFAAQHSQGHGSCGMDPDHDPESHNDPRAFAQHFLSKRAEYSRSKNGLAASMFEAWLLESSGYLFSKFVETVLEKGNKFVAIFDSKLNKEELRRMRSGTAPFMQFETLIEAGEHNGEEIFEFTMFDCTASATPKKDADPNVQSTPNAVDGREGDVKLPGTNGTRFESLLPSTREQYDAVYEEGGLTREALNVVLGDDSIETLVEGPHGCRVVDANGVAWTSESGELWLPDVDSIDESDDVTPQEPRNYREFEGATGGPCRTCRYMRHREGDGYCTLFAWVVESGMSCDEWGARQEGVFAEADGEDCCELFERVLASDFGTWELREQGDTALVVVDESAWEIPHTFDEVLETVGEIGRLYEADLAAERDLVVEATLRDFVEDCGEQAEMPDESLVESQREARDAIVESNNAARLEEAAGTPTIVRTLAHSVGIDEAKRLWEEAGEQVSEQYPDAERESERWHTLKLGVFKTMMRGAIDERQKVAPALAFSNADRKKQGGAGLSFPDNERTFRKGAFKVSAQVLKLFKEAGIIDSPADAVFKSVRKVVDAIPREKLPALVGVTKNDASAMADAQDVIAHRPRKSFQMFLRKVQMVSPKLHGVLQKIGLSNAALIYYMIVSRISGEDSALWLFKRFFSSFSDHPEDARRRTKGPNGYADAVQHTMRTQFGESFFPVEFDPEAARLEEADDKAKKGDEEGDGKKP